MPIPRLRSALCACFLAALAAGIVVPGGARAQTPSGEDPARRGLDVGVVGPTEAPAGAALTFALRAVGYGRVAEARALPSAVIELAWDPTMMPELPPPVQVTTDASGRAAATTSMPRLRAGATAAKLLVTVRHGAHARTREIEVQSSAARDVELVVPETSVIPGSTVGAWIRVRDRAEGRRLAGLRVVAELTDGGVARDRVTVSTDATGSALAQLRVPPMPAGGRTRWALGATLDDGTSAAAVAVSPREELPAQPDLDVSWTAESLGAGEAAVALVRLRDAVGDPVAGATLAWLVSLGDDDAEPAWERASRVATDRDGLATLSWSAPTSFAGDALHAKLSVRWVSAERQLERSARLVVRRRGAGALRAVPEAGALVPGLPQRLWVQALADDGAPVTGPARVKGDGLDVAVELDRRGEAEVTWTPPDDVGSRRDVGPCARAVAATVTVEAPGLARRGGRAFACVAVDRARRAIVRVDPPLGRAGGRARVRIVGRTPQDSRGPFAVHLAPAGEEGGVVRALWLEDGGAGADVELPRGPRGAYHWSAFAPRDGGPSLAARGAMLLAPAALPSVEARVVGGRIAPSGEAVVEVRLRDEAGRPLEGLVAGIVFDAFGSTHTDGIDRLDTRRALCEEAGVEGARCADLWVGGAAADALLRASLAGSPPARGASPILDPGATAAAHLEGAFATTLRSLEGAVFEATSSPERLIDARRDGPRGRTFNPELFRIVTDALGAPPTTPGGEPLELSDLVAIDPQVRFDVVARRVTRLKLFRVASAVREHRLESRLDAGEPALRDPNALLALLTSRGQIEPSALLDPWGGTMSFRKARGAELVPLTAVPGWELSSPGPDGRAGTGDDVDDPFERIVRSGTPYARASGEDDIVLARGDLRVFDATIAAWSALLEEHTGTSLGDQGGRGHGRLGGSHRSKPPSVRMGATMVNRRGFEPAWSLPTRTQAGVARLTLPLGALDTTYRVVVIGLADGGDPAVTRLDLPISVPISTRLETGDQWTVGDRVEVAARVRNRTDRDEELVAELGARGAARLVPGTRSRATLRVPARQVASLHLPVEAARSGEGHVSIVLRRPDGAVVDAVQADVTASLPGRRTVESRARWASGEIEIPAIVEGPGRIALGPPALIVEAGPLEALEGALSALDPDRDGSPDALADAVEAAARVTLAAADRGLAPGDVLLRRAAALRARAAGHLISRRLDARTAEVRRLRIFVPPEPTSEGEEAEATPPPCGEAEPPSSGRRDRRASIDRALSLVEAEPPATGAVTDACWESVVEAATEDVVATGDAELLARLVLALAERPHRVEQARLLALRLARRVSLEPSGRFSLEARLAGRRDARALVAAALLRASAAGARLPAASDALAPWLLVQRDGAGGFGSPRAARGAVAALAAWPHLGSSAGPSVTVVALDGDGDALGAPRAVRVGRRPQRVTLDPRATAVRVTSAGKGALVRLERAMQVEPAASTEIFESPLALHVRWPDKPRAGTTGVLEVSLRTRGPREEAAIVHVPLPAGVTLAEGVAGVRALPGGLTFEATASPEDPPIPKRIPIRLGLAGSLRAPEATATQSDLSAPPAHAPGPRLVVRGSGAR